LPSTPRVRKKKKVSRGVKMAEEAAGKDGGGGAFVFRYHQQTQLPGGKPLKMAL